MISISKVGLIISGTVTTTLSRLVREARGSGSELKEDQISPVTARSTAILTLVGFCKNANQKPSAKSSIKWRGTAQIVCMMADGLIRDLFHTLFHSSNIVLGLCFTAAIPSSVALREKP